MKIRKEDMKKLIRSLIKEIKEEEQLEGDAVDDVKDEEDQEISKVKEKYAVDKVRAKDRDRESKV